MQQTFTYSSKAENSGKQSERDSFLKGALISRFVSTRSKVSQVLNRVKLRAISPVLKKAFFSMLIKCTTCPAISETQHYKVP